MSALSTDNAPGFVEIRAWETDGEYPRPLCCGMVENVFTESLPPGVFGLRFLGMLVTESNKKLNKA